MYPSTTNQDGFAQFGLTFRPSVRLVTLVRRFVHAFYDEIINEPDVASRVALATHELLENAVKYATMGDTTVRVELNRLEKRIVVQTWNRATSENISALQQVVDTMGAAPNPAEHYYDLLRQSVRRDSGSGLGLARIRVEAEMTLTYELIGEGVAVLAHTYPNAGELS